MHFKPVGVATGSLHVNVITYILQLCSCMHYMSWLCSHAPCKLRTYCFSHFPINGVHGFAHLVRCMAICLQMHTESNTRLIHCSCNDAPALLGIIIYNASKQMLAQNLKVLCESVKALQLLKIPKHWLKSASYYLTTLQCTNHIWLFAKSE